jgi:Tol biopolymer transport system component
MGPVVNSAFQDFGPAISKDGLSLYLSSDRPGGLGGFDLWVAERSTPSAAWGAPRNLGAVINTGASENVPALSRDGHWLFFNSTRPGFGAQDIWVSWREHVQDNFGWQPPFNLGAGVNSPFGDVNPAYLETDANGAMLFFTSNRPGGAGLFDIYVSHLSSSGFGTATLVGELSGLESEQRPTIRFDGLEMFFHVMNPLVADSGDLWSSTRDDIASLWSPPIRLDALNTAFADQQPYLAADRETLLFASNRPGGYGALDLYVATRSGPGGSNQP